MTDKKPQEKLEVESLEIKLQAPKTEKKEDKEEKKEEKEESKPAVHKSAPKLHVPVKSTKSEIEILEGKLEHAKRHGQKRVEDERKLLHNEAEHDLEKALVKHGRHVQRELMGKISMVVSSSRHIAYHDKMTILREIRTALGEDAD